MHPRTAELLEYLDRQADVLRAAFESVPPDRRMTRPAADRWAAAEVVHHIAIVEQRLTKRLEALVEQARALEPERDTSPVLAVVNTERVTNRTSRYKTAEAAEPRDTNPATVWSEFESARQQLRRVAASADGLAMGGVSAPHPALGPLNGYEWMAFAGGHAARHAQQIIEDAATG